MTTPLYSIPEMVGNTLNFSSLNIILRFYEQLGGMTIESAEDTPPASTPADGQAHLVIPTAIGAFSGQENNIAFSVGGAWYFITPQKGYEVYQVDIGNYIVYDGTEWLNSSRASTSLETLTAVTDLIYARYMLIDSTTLIHTLSDPTLNQVATIKNTGSTSFDVSTTNFTITLGAGAVETLVTDTTTQNWVQL